MKTNVKRENGVLLLRLSGELDHHAARESMEEIENQIERSLPRDCAMDLRDLAFMDSSGIALILKTYRRMNEIGGRLWVQNVQKQPMRVLEASGIERIVSVSPAE